MTKPIADARIVVTEHWDYSGGLERLTYQWEGGDVVCISYCFYSALGLYPKDCRLGNVFSVGPYRLRVIWADPFSPYEVLAVRDSPRAWRRIVGYVVSSRLESVYRRLIITAAVWTLAEYNATTVPTWRDLYVVKWVARRFSRAGD